MKLRTAAALTALLLAGLASISCTQGTLGIFASIQRETKIEDRGLDNGLTPVQMVATGSAATTPGSYFLAAGVLYVRPQNPDSGVAWKKIDPPSGMHYVNGVAYQPDTGRIVVSYYTSSASSISGAVYYRLADLSDSWHKSTTLSTGNSGIDSIGKIFTMADDRGSIGTNAIYASVETGGNSYELYRSTDGNTFAATGVTSQSPFIDAAVDASDNMDIFASSANIVTYSSTNVVTTVPSPSGGPALTAIGGIYYDAAGTFNRASPGTAALFVTTGTSIVRGTYTGSWSWSTIVSSYSVSSNDVEFTGIVATENLKPYSTILVGTKANGYFLLNANGGSGISEVDPESNYAASDLRTSAITMLYVDTDAGDIGSSPVSPSQTDMVFAGGYAKGLWETYYTGSKPSWVQN